MADELTLWTPVTINLKAERDRISTPRMFNAKQRKVLLGIVKHFEKGDLCECIELAQSDSSKALFDYPVWEFVTEEIYDVIQNMSMGQVYKRKENI
jgi:hypothetical protein